LENIPLAEATKLTKLLTVNGEPDVGVTVNDQLTVYCCPGFKFEVEMQKLYWLQLGVMVAVSI
jgi:hypothetical protein